jgi:branched-chain amino acid transport system substrate-binding protein
MHQAESLNGLTLLTLLPGIVVNTSHTNHGPIKAMRLMRWDGKSWVFFGNIIEGASS